MRLRRLVVCVAALCVSIVASSGFADDPATDHRLLQPPIELQADGVPTFRTFFSPTGGGAGAPRGDCPPEIRTWSSINFSSTGQQTFTAPPGMVETEIAAATYTVPADEWPIIVRTVEMIWVQNHFNATSTEYTFIVWQGTPNTGTIVATYSSDGELIPHVTLPFAGQQAVNASTTIDPTDPDQILVMNNGSNKFSVGIRIDSHNNPPVSSCTCSGLGTLPAICCPPLASQNAFPAMDNALNNGSQQWLYTRDCPGAAAICSFVLLEEGWHLLSNSVFSGFVNDWALQVTYESASCVTPVGGCCKQDGTCSIETESFCAGILGTYRGDGTTCTGAQCPQPSGSCCFLPSGCANLTQANCGVAGGFWQGAFTTCASTICFPRGACCLPDGSCLDDVLLDDCLAIDGGLFGGDDSTCATTNCPQPLGACCLSNGGCIDVTEANCDPIPNSTWKGFLTDCNDFDFNGIADDCEAGDPCDGTVLGDYNGSGGVSGADIQGFTSALISASPSQADICAGDFNANNGLDMGDIAGMVTALMN